MKSSKPQVAAESSGSKVFILITLALSVAVGVYFFFASAPEAKL
jgi:hypothetical protein